MADKGVAELLAEAPETRACAIGDSGTFYAHGHDLVILYGGSAALPNEYSVIALILKSIRVLIMISP